ncbi:MAG: hypothetical protein V4692_08340 [Bdellovibrionota bacterium]
MISKSLVPVMIASALALSACGKDAFPVREEFKPGSLSRIEKLENDEAPAYSIGDTTVVRNPETGSITVYATIVTRTVIEVVKLSGSVQNGIAKLADTNAGADESSRMVGTITCKDESCESAVVELYMSINGKTLKKRFLTSSLAAKDAADKTGTPADPEDLSKLGDRDEEPAEGTQTGGDVKQEGEKLIPDGEVIVLNDEPTPAEAGDEATAENNPLAGDDTKPKASPSPKPKPSPSPKPKPSPSPKPKPKASPSPSPSPKPSASPKPKASPSPAPAPAPAKAPTRPNVKPTPVRAPAPNRASLPRSNKPAGTAATVGRGQSVAKFQAEAAKKKAAAEAAKQKPNLIEEVTAQVGAWIQKRMSAPAPGTVVRIPLPNPLIPPPPTGD